MRWQARGHKEIREIKTILSIIAENMATLDDCFS